MAQAHSPFSIFEFSRALKGKRAGGADKAGGTNDSGRTDDADGAGAVGGSLLLLDGNQLSFGLLVAGIGVGMSDTSGKSTLNAKKT